MHHLTLNGQTTTWAGLQSGMVLCDVLSAGHSCMKPSGQETTRFSLCMISFEVWAPRTTRSIPHLLHTTASPRYLKWHYNLFTGAITITIQLKVDVAKVPICMTSYHQLPVSHVYQIFSTSMLHTDHRRVTQWSPRLSMIYCTKTTRTYFYKITSSAAPHFYLLTERNFHSDCQPTFIKKPM